MQSRPRIQALTFFAASVLGLSATYLGAGSANSLANRVPAQTPSIASAQGAAEFYATETGVTKEEAERRLNLQQAASLVAGEASRTAGTSLIRSHLVHVPEFGIEVLVTPDAPIAAIEAVLKESPVPVKMEVQDRPSADELLRAIDDSSRAWVEEFPEIQGVGIVPEESAIELDLNTMDEGRAQEIAQSVQSSLTNSAMHVVHAEYDGKTADGQRAGYDMSACTEGFSVRPTDGVGYWGVTTAGHCTGVLSWESFSGGGPFTTSFLDGQDGPAMDIQVRRIYSFSPQARLHADSTSTAIPVTAVADREAMDGVYACHRGKTTGYSCGTVTQVNFKPVYDGACGGASGDSDNCDSVYGKMTGVFLKCNVGDSGGPVFDSETAAGSYKGQSSSGSTSAACNYLFYTPIKKVGALGYQVLKQ